MSRDFYELCYDQYKLEMTDADSLYQKAGVVIVVVSVLGTLISTLGRIDIIDQCFARVDIFMFYLSALIAIVSLAASVLFLILFASPNGKYMTLDSMDAWHSWRIKYEDFLKNSTQDAKTEAPLRVDEAMFDHLCPRLAEAQPVNAKLNATRRRMFGSSVKMAAIATIAVAIQALFALILTLQGI